MKFNAKALFFSKITAYAMKLRMTLQDLSNLSKIPYRTICEQSGMTVKILNLEIYEKLADALKTSTPELIGYIPDIQYIEPIFKNENQYYISIYDIAYQRLMNVDMIVQKTGISRTIITKLMTTKEVRTIKFEYLHILSKLFGVSPILFIKRKDGNVV